MIQGMNLGSSDSTKKTKPKTVHNDDKKTRIELKQERARENYLSKQDKPYNRTFMDHSKTTSHSDVDVSFVGRVERKKYRKQAQQQTSFVSWVMGVFSGLIALLLVMTFVGSTDISDGWTNNASATPMIIDNTKTIETESSVPLITEDELEDLQEQEELEDSAIDLESGDNQQ